MYPGFNLKIKNKNYLVPALSLGQLRGNVRNLLKEHDKEVEKGDLFDILIARGKVIIEALKRNYPNISESDVFDALDLQNTSDIWSKVLGASGFTPGEAEESATGEALAAETVGT